MKYFWITLSLLTALTIGCKSEPSTDDPSSADDGSASVTSDGGDDSLDLPPLDDSELTSTPAQTTSDAGEDDSSDDLPSDTEVAQAEGDDVRKDIEARLQAAIAAQDVDSAIAILQEAVQKLPGDPSIVRTLAAVLIQRDMGLAQSGDKDAAVKSMQSTSETINKLLNEEVTLPDQFVVALKINEARQHAHANDAEKTLATLAEAMDLGFNQLGAMAMDPFFETIKENEKFKEGLQGLFRDSAKKKIAEAESFDFDFELTDLEGKPIKLADYAGKIVIVDIWGTWCPPCKMEIPHFVQLQDTYKDDLAIVGITYERHDKEPDSMSGVYQDEQNRTEAVQGVLDFAKGEGINYTLALGDKDTQGMIPNLTGFPTTLFIDRDGKVRLMVVGYHPYEQLESYVAALMDETAG